MFESRQRIFDVVYLFADNLEAVGGQILSDYHTIPVKYQTPGWR